MSEVTFSVIESKALQLGNNVFEQGTIAVAAATEVKAGTLLKRDGNKKFAVATASDTSLAVVPFDMKNTSTATVNLGFRALIGGLVRKDMLNLNGAALTSAQADGLRDYGIIAVDTTDLSRVHPTQGD
ncbi:MAG: hypothetical protein FWC97_00325 [Treponema sp.]|nr:hypothetical protein [Treponema sp.]